MKKFRPFLSIIASLSLILITGCKFVDNDEAASGNQISVDAPSVIIGEKSAILIGNKLNSDISEIFVYRIQTSATGASEKHIGTIYPKESSNYLPSFTDTLVYKTEKYKYKFLYKQSNISYISAWTSEVTISGGYASSQPLTYNVGTAVLKYDANDPYRFTISEDDIGVLDETNVSLFKKYKSNLQNSIILRANGSAAAYQIDVALEKDKKFKIPASLQGKTITCGGLVGKYVKIKTDENNVVTYFTEPAPIKIVDASGNELTSITITAGSSDSGTAY